jgi:hypothetical protein
MGKINILHHINFGANLEKLRVYTEIDGHSIVILATAKQRQGGFFHKLSAGDPTRTGAAADWRPVGPPA